MKTTHVKQHTRGANLNDPALKAEAERQRTMWHYKHPQIQEWFEATPEITFGCYTKKTRAGTREFATIFINGTPQGSGSYFWSNRPWQEYTYHDAMTQALNNANLTPIQYDQAKKYVTKDHNETSMLKTTAMVAALGDVFATTQKEKNDWKTRMLKAGLADKGLQMPDDWNTLTEDEKEKRLNAAIATLK